jgi:hypothetical protein
LVDKNGVGPSESDLSLWRRMRGKGIAERYHTGIKSAT